MKKGFTLVELLAVMVILTVILSISIPVIINNISLKKEQARNEIYDMILLAANSYKDDNNINVYTEISIDDLCEDDYIKCPIIDPVTNEEMNKTIFIDNKGASLDKYVKVIFNPNGGSVSLSSKTYEINSTYSDMPVPIKTDYIFAGWYTKISNGTLVTNSTVVTLSVNQTQTLYARWSK